MKNRLSILGAVLLVFAAVLLAADPTVPEVGAAVPFAKADPGAIHSVAYSHQDLGYANYPHILRTENRLENIFRSVRYAEQTKDWPDASKYRFQQEGSEPFPYFLSQCTPAEREQLAKYMKEGRIAVAASLTTVLSDRLNPESAARLFYLSNRHLPDLLGTPPGKVAIINDVTGVCWSLPIYCEAAGVPFLFNGHNTCGRCNELESAPIVRWKGPAGTGEVLVFSSVYNYHAVKNPQKELPGTAARSGKAITPNYIPVWLQGHDFAITNLDMATAAKAWNDQGNQPEVRMSTMELYLDALAKRQTPEKTPTVSKTGPCQWMDQPITDAELFGQVRQAAEWLPTAEKFSSFAMVSAEAGYPWFELTTGWHNLLCNYEHTVGAACWRCKDAEGWRHYETEAVEHEEEGRLARNIANLALGDAIDRITTHIDTRHPQAVAVFNSLGQSRTDIVCCNNLKVASVTDTVTGETIPVQQLPESLISTAIFVAKDVPALGYKQFSMPYQPDKPDASDSLGKPGTTAETQFYRIAIDPQTGTIASLFDKELNQELVKKDAAHAFNQYLCEWYPEAKGKSSWSQPPVASDVKIYNGRVAAIIRIRSKAEGVNELIQTITLYHAIKRVDFALRMSKLPSGRSLADYNANNLKGKESVFVALPLDIPGFKAVYQTAGGGVAEPIKDYFTGVGTAFQAVQHFTDLSNDKFGVTISPLDFSLVEFGRPRSDALSRATRGSEAVFEQKMEYPKDSSIYLYLMDNMFTTNIRVDQRGAHLFRWSLRSHAGDWQAGKADQFGEAVSQPLIATRLAHRPRSADEIVLTADAHSFASVDADNVAITTCKLAEYNGDGFIIRLVETRGRKTTATLSLPFLSPIASANETNLVETDLPGKPLDIAGTAVKLELPPYGVKTIRVRSAARAGGEVHDIVAEAVSDLEVELKWPPVPDAAFYRVYRGTTAEFAPSALTLVAVTRRPTCYDQARDYAHAWITNRLMPETAYYYRIEAVSRGNRRGPASAAIQVKTLGTAQKACPPQPVSDLYAILVSPLAPANQINLFWRSNVEPNIAAYEIHRSTTAYFKPSPATLLAKVPVQTSAKGTDGNKYLDHQMYLDANPAPATTYYYRVRAVTQTGLAGTFFPSAPATATSKPLQAPAPLPAAGKALMGNDGLAQ